MDGEILKAGRGSQRGNPGGIRRRGRKTGAARQKPHNLSRFGNVLALTLSSMPGCHESARCDLHLLGS